MYVEEIEYKITNRGKVIEAGAVKPVPRDHEYYISLFPYDQTIIDYVRINNSVTGHTGKHFCKYIIFDIDRENDLEGARKDALSLISHLQSEYGLSPDDLWIWFSGSKGFHVAIIDKIYGDLGAREGMGDAIKRAAIRAAKRRGSSMIIFLPRKKSASSRANGTRVVLPVPGGACSTTALCDVSVLSS